jgi:hypothetical protein
MSLRPLRLVWLATAALVLAPSAASAAWTELPTPGQPGANQSSLQAVDCTSANSCVAVGQWFSGPPIGGAGGPLAERWDGTSWQILPAPPEGELRDVSCPWPTFCFGVGSTGTGILVEVWNGNRWSVQSTPIIPNGALNAVSCSGIVACTAVGTDGTGGTLALRWEGAGWHVQPTPDAPGADSTQLRDVSCPVKRTCTAVGLSSTGPAGVQVSSPFVTRWFGRVNAWGLQSAPKPAGAQDASLAGVSCPVAFACVAVGEFDVDAGPITALAERRMGSTWSLLPAPELPSGSEISRLAAVSCPSLALCRAVGTAETATSLVTMAERFDGTNWHLESIPFTWPGGSRPFVNDVSCPSRSFCMAVGNWGFRFSGAPLSAKWTPP